MNTKNNRRKKDSQEKIEKAFIDLIQTKQIEEISVTDICTLANLNRSTFYTSYIDIYDLVDKIKDRMIENIFDVYKEERESKEHSYNFLKLFKHIKDNQLFYKSYFKLNLDLSHHFLPIDISEAIRFHGSYENLEYHIEFFKAGISAVIKKWLYEGCRQTPEQIFNIIQTEYQWKKEKM